MKLINEISGRRTSQRGQIAGDTQQERIQNWYNHFVGILRSEPDASVADINMPNIFKDLGIKKKIGTFQFLPTYEGCALAFVLLVGSLYVP